MSAMKLRSSCVVVGLLSLVLSLAAETSSSSFASAQVPPFIQFSGVAGDVYGKPLTGVVGVTFYLYQEQQGGAPLWMETQNVQPDKTGHYSVLLGSTTSQGLPASIFTSGEAHWLGVQVQGQDEQPRVLLVSAPYALKAGDAETLGGKSLSAFVLNETQATASSGSSAPTQTAVGSNPKTSLKPGASPTVGGSGTTDYVAKFTNSTTLGNSLIFDNGTNVGIGTTSPAAPLHISGNRLLLTSGTTAEVQFAGSASSARFGEDGTGSFFASDTNGRAVRFLTNNGTLNEWMRITSTGNVGIGTTAPAAKLEVNGAARFDGLVSFAGGQSFPGTIAGVTAGTDLTGGGSSGNVTLNLDTTQVPLLAAANTFTTGQTISTSSYGAGLNVYAAAPQGIYASVNQDYAVGIYGDGSGAGNGVGVTAAGGTGVSADGVNASVGSGGYAGNFSGDLNVTGAIFAGTKDFRIDHPLDPANKYLVHASVESSEMMNIYTGNVTTDSGGHVTVQLPEWFEALNTDFRYQLTVIGQFAQAIVASEIQDNKFSIRTDKPNVKVSWQVTSVRQDAYAKAHPLVVEQGKEARLRGFYIHPELYGAPPEKQIEWARHPQLMKHQQAKVRPSALTVSGRP